MAESTHMEDLVSTAQTVEDAVRYNIGTQHMEGHGGSHVPPQRSGPVGMQPNIIPRLSQFQQMWPQEVVN